MAKQHDGDQRRKFPPKVHARKPEGYGEAVAKDDNDGERNEGHSSRALAAQFGNRATKEHLPAIDENDKPEKCWNVFAVREPRAGQPKDVLKSDREDDGGDGEPEAQPKFTLECLRVMMCVRIVRVPLSDARHGASPRGCC